MYRTFLKGYGHHKQNPLCFILYFFNLFASSSEVLES
jgi:hypothetical protein